jgi:integrase
VDDTELEASRRLAERWIHRWSLPAEEVTAAVVQRALDRRSYGQNGDRVAAAYADRRRRTVRTMWMDAEHRDLVPSGIWPRPEAMTKKQRVANQKLIDRRTLPSKEQAEAAIAALVSHQPGSRGYHALTALVFYAGLRPSEALVLDISSLDLPERGWGTATVETAAQDEHERWGLPEEQIGETKTGTGRDVPLPPVLVKILRNYIGGRTDGVLVSTRTGNRPTYSNWSRAWNRARRSAGGNWRLYDLRHAHATLALDAGVPAARLAKLMGNSAETIWRCYIGEQHGHDDQARRAMDRVWG